jgi:hypothetical protein
MKDEDDDVLVGREAQEEEAKERSRGEVEGALSLGFGEASGLELARMRVREVLKVEGGEGDGSRRMNDLERLAVRRGEGGAQRFVAADEFGEGCRECPLVERPTEAHCRRKIVGDIAGLQLVQEPQSLLCKRGGRRSELLTSSDRNPRLCGLRSLRLESLREQLKFRRWQVSKSL